MKGLITLLVPLTLVTAIEGWSPFINAALGSMNFTLPPISFHVNLIGSKTIHCDITLRCKSLQIGSLDANGIDTPHKYKAFFSAKKIASDCQGELHYQDDTELQGTLGLEMWLPDIEIGGEWDFFWKQSFIVSADHERHLPYRVSLHKSLVRTHLKRTSFKVLGQPRILSHLEDSILNTLAPEFGALILDPALRIGLNIITFQLSVLLDFLNHAISSFFQYWLPFRPKSISYFENKVQEAISVNTTLVRMVSDMVSSLLASDDARGELVINSIIRETLLDDNRPGSAWSLLNETGTIDVCLFDSNLGIRVSHLDIIGLDSFENLIIADIVGEYTTRNKIQLGSRLQANISLVLSENDEYEIPFNVVIGIDQPDILVTILTAVDSSGFANVTFGSLFENPMEFLKCILSAAAQIVVVEFELGDTGFGSLFHISGDDELFAFIESITAIGKDLFARPLYNIIQFHSTSFLQFLTSNAYTQSLMQHAQCPTRTWPPPEASQNLIDWSVNPIIRLASWLVNDLVGTSGDLNVGVVMDWFMNYVFEDKWFNDSLSIPGSIIYIGPFSINRFFPFLDQPAFIGAGFGNLTLHGINHVQHLEIFKTKQNSPYEFFNWITLNQVSIKLDLTLDVVGLLDKQPDLIHDVVTIDMRTVPAATRLYKDHPESSMLHMFFDALAKIDRSSLDFFQPKTLLSECAAFMFPNPPEDERLFSSQPAPLGLKQLLVTLGNITVDAKCLSCTSPTLDEILEYMSTPTSAAALLEFIHIATPVIEGIFTNTSDLVLFGGANANHGVNRMLRFLRSRCLGIPLPPPRPQNKYVKPWWIPPMKVLMAVAAAGMLGLFLFSLLHANIRSWIHRTHQSKRLATHLLQSDFLNTGSDSATSFSPSPINNTMSPDTEPSPNRSVSFDDMNDPTFHRHVVMEFRRRVSSCVVSRTSLLQSPREVVSESDTLYLLGHDKSMFRHPSISPFVSFFIACALALNFFMFVSGNFYPFGQVIVVIDLAGDTFKQIPILTFSIDYGVDLMAESGSLLTSVLIGLCSGLLPWIKVALLGYCWVAPANVLTVEHRGYVLLMLEGIGKWTMAMCYFCIILMASMTTSLTVPGIIQFIPQESFTVKVGFVPSWGFFSFVCAALLSTILNHFIIYHHDNIRQHNMKAMNEPTTIIEEATEDFSLGEPLELVVPSSWQNKLVSSALVFWPFLYVYSHLRHLFAFEFMGVVGFGIQVLGGAKVREQSIFSLLNALLNADPFHLTHFFALLFVFLAYLLLVVIAPGLLILLANVVWFGRSFGKSKTSGKFRHGVSIVYRLLSAWNSTVVVAVCVLVVSQDLPNIFDAVADGLPFCPRVLGSVVGLLGASDSEAACFAVSTTVLPGMWVVLGYACYSIALGNVVYKSIISKDKQFWVTI